jgi:hypothetical protein
MFTHLKQCLSVWNTFLVMHYAGTDKPELQMPLDHVATLHRPAGVLFAPEHSCTAQSWARHSVDEEDNIEHMLALARPWATLSCTGLQFVLVYLYWISTIVSSVFEFLAPWNASCIAML